MQLASRSEPRLSLGGGTSENGYAPAQFRALVCLGVGLLLGAATCASHLRWLHFPSDWDEIHAAARALLDGADPYRAMRLAHLSHRFSYPLIYPGTAVVLGLPFALFSLSLALGLWTALESPELGARWRLSSG